MDLKKLENRELTLPSDIYSNHSYMDGLIKNVSQINQDFEKSMKPVWEKREKVEQAQIDTAKHTAEMNDSLKKVIENQNKHIEILEEQLKDINLTLDCIFNSVYEETEILEDSIEIYKSIYFEIRNGKKVNLKEMLMDKGLDVIIQVFMLILSQVSVKK